MKKDKQHLLLKIIIGLSVIGLITSIYLAQSHFSPPTGGSFCDISSSVSCSLVNTSSYSILFGVPVAIFGALWFLVLLFASWRAMKNETLYTALLGWNVLGILFVVYLIIAEFILQAICPLCTIVHVITIITFTLSILLYKNHKKPSKKHLIKTLKPWIIGIIILNLIPLIWLNLPQGEQVDYSELTKCVTEKGVNMYGSFKCGICAKQKELLGDSFKHINEIECHPQGENAQTQLCLDKGIEGTPTWILEPNGKEVNRKAGFMDIEELKEFSGCEFEVKENAA